MKGLRCRGGWCRFKFIFMSQRIQTIPKIIARDYVDLFTKVADLLEKGKNKAYTQINSVLIYTYWHIGREIVEFEQGGEKRAKYGKKTIKQLSIDLTKRFGRGFSYRNLQQIKKFYLLFPKVQTVSAESFKLSWSHYVRLMSIENQEERSFYEIECIKNNWSARELCRQFDSSLYERVALSRNKNEIKKLAKNGQIIKKTEDLFKEPYVLEFLGLHESCQYSENSLEKAIIDNLQQFLLELGKGFTFMWDMFCGGEVISGEDFLAGAKRETTEEVGIIDPELEYLFTDRYKSELDNVITAVYKVLFDGKIIIEPKEIEKGFFVSMDELKALIKKERFCDDSLQYFERLEMEFL